MEQAIIHPSKQLKNTSNRLDVLLALRGIACLMVLVCHCAPPRSTIIYKGYDLSWVLFASGEVAVWIFFVLSGYLMGKAFYTERYTLDVSGVWNFWRNRMLRIFPLYYFSTLILALFVNPDILRIENWGYLARTLTFTYEYTIPGVNSVLWSLSMEVQFYLCVPFIYTYLKSRLFKRKQVLLAFASIIFLAFLLRLVVWITLGVQVRQDETYLIKYWYAQLIMNLDVFLCGFLINPWLKYKKHTHYEQDFQTKPNKQFKFPRLPLENIGVVLFVCLYLFTAHHYYHQEMVGLPRSTTGVRTSTTFFILQPLTALVGAFFIFAFESDVYQDSHKIERLSFHSILKNPIRVIEIFGNLSYGVYIWHQAILGKILPFFTSPIPIINFAEKLIVTLFLSSLLATVTYYLVELPATKWKIYRPTETEK
jgi:peptidoglycan/LPS O-acetylase OafA/YrhL